MKLLATTALIASMAVIGIGNTHANEVEYRLNIGFFTEHYLGRSGELNEKNQLIQVSVAKDRNVLTAASFVNSHFNQSYLIGYGREKNLTEDLKIGGYLAVVEGYEGFIKTHYEGLLFMPVLKMDYYGFTVNLMPAVYVVGYEISF